MPVVHVITTVQRNPDNRMPHWKAQGRWICESGTPGHEAPASLRPLISETIIHKQFFSGFSGPELAALLAAHQADTLFIAGIHLHACIRATALDGYMRGFNICIAEDAACSDDPIHAAITRRYLSERAIGFAPVSRIIEALDANGGVIRDVRGQGAT